VNPGIPRSPSWKRKIRQHSRFPDDAIVWRDKRLDAGQIQASRAGFAISFGSCSFREPVDELESLARATRPGNQ